MSTAGTPGPISQPAAAWFPSLSSSGLPRAAVNGMTQSFSLIYSLRDTVAQLQATLNSLVQYGTANDRKQINAQAVPDGALFFETDTGSRYQARLNPNSTTRDWFLT